MLSLGLWWLSLSEGCVAGSWSSWCPPGPPTHSSSGPSLHSCFPVGGSQGVLVDELLFFPRCSLLYFLSYFTSMKVILHKVPLCLFFQSVAVPLSGSMAHLFCKSLLPVWPHLQTSCGCTLTYHPGKLYGPNMYSWGASLMMGLQLVFLSVMTILWAQLFSWISVHLAVHLTRQYFISLSARLLWRWCQLLFPPPSRSHFTV